MSLFDPSRRRSADDPPFMPRSTWFLVTEGDDAPTEQTVVRRPDKRGEPRRVAEEPR